MLSKSARASCGSLYGSRAIGSPTTPKSFTSFLRYKTTAQWPKRISPAPALKDHYASCSLVKHTPLKGLEPQGIMEFTLANIRALICNAIVEEFPDYKQGMAGFAQELVSNDKVAQWFRDFKIWQRLGSKTDQGWTDQECVQHFCYYIHALVEESNECCDVVEDWFREIILVREKPLLQAKVQELISKGTMNGARTVMDLEILQQLGVMLDEAAVIVSDTSPLTTHPLRSGSVDSEVLESIPTSCNTVNKASLTPSIAKPQTKHPRESTKLKHQVVKPVGLSPELGQKLSEFQNDKTMEKSWIRAKRSSTKFVDELFFPATVELATTEVFGNAQYTRIIVDGITIAIGLVADSLERSRAEACVSNCLAYTTET